MKLPVLLTLLLFVILKINASDSTINQTIPSIKDGMDELRNEVADIFGFATRKGRLFVSLEDRRFKCKVLNNLYRSSRRQYPYLRDEILSDRMVDMLDNCPENDFKISEFFNQPFIFPGTNWCGHGAVVRLHRDLGIFNETDFCCREHDHCDDIIKPGRVKHHLYNLNKTSRLHCRCDEAFRKCLMKVDDMVSNIVGYLFFSVLQNQCFDFKHPATGCLQWKRGAVKSYCVEYEFQKHQPKKWQWFDKEPYV